jgi:hypothetical protein
MARRKLPKEQVKETVGVKLLPSTVRKLNKLADQWDCFQATAGRFALEFGMAIIEALEAKGITVKFSEDANGSKITIEDEFSIVPGSERPFTKEEKEGSAEKSVKENHL